VASFDRAIQMVALPALFLGSILDSVLFPLLSRCQEEHREKALDYVYRSQEVLLVATVPAAVVLCFMAPAATLLLLGRQWETTGTMAAILFLSFPFLSLTRLSDCVLRAFGDTRVIFWNKVVGATLALVGLWFGAYWGAWGAAVSCVAAKVAGAIFALVMTHRRVGLDTRRLVRTFLPAIRITLLLAAVFGALAALLLAFPRLSPALHLAALAIPGTLICGVFLLARADIAGTELEPLLRKAKAKLTGCNAR
jgi:O-antigen/teichoic acid export membrane protein